MAKTSKISWVMYGNEKLKPVYFHGNRVYPLYIRLGYDRNNTIFKSYYFDLFSKPKYTIAVAGLVGGPTIEKIMELEEELINFIVGNLVMTLTLKILRRHIVTIVPISSRNLKMGLMII